MKKWSLPGAAGILAAAGYFLRRLAYAGAVDEKNLLVRGHPLMLGLWILTAAALVSVAVLALRKEKGSERYADNFSADAPAFFGHGMMAAAVLVTVLLNDAVMPGRLGLLWKVLGWAAPVGLFLAGFARLRGKVPFFGFYALACLFFAIHVVNHYQAWCSNPQLTDYFFSLMGMVALALFAYQQAAFAADAGERRMLILLGMGAVYLCGTELAASRYPYLYLGGILWCLTGLPKEK